jgi:hypothetical protein
VPQEVVADRPADHGIRDDRRLCLHDHVNVHVKLEVVR